MVLGIKKYGAFALLLSLGLFLVTGCSSVNSTTHAKTTPGTEVVPATTIETAPISQEAAVTVEAAQTEEVPQTTEAEPVDLPRLPRVGLSVEYIDATELGEHDDESEVIDSGKFKGGVSYYWRAKNGTNDIVYSAIVVGGKVVDVSKWKTGFDYWYQEGSSLPGEFPNLYAAGKERTSSTSGIMLYDPSDYDDPEDFADDNEAYFAAQGIEDAWDYAYSYWERFV